MSTTDEAADVDASGHSATSNSATISNSSSPDMGRCSECYPELTTPAVKYCLNCMNPLCAKCDINVVHTSKTTRDHVRMNIEDHLAVENAMGHSSPTDDEIHADDKNKFCFFSPVDHRIHLQSRLADLVPDQSARPSLVAFIGPSGVGKSTLLRLLISLNGERDAEHMPLAGGVKSAQSTSADIHMYSDGLVNSTYPLLYIDSEGRGGSKEPLAMQSMWKACRKFYEGLGEYEDFKDYRSQHVQVSYPRMLYNFADVLCFVFSGDWRERETIMKPLLEWGQSAAVGTANRQRPQLILIFNKKGTESAHLDFDEFQNTYEKWIQGDNGRSDDRLKLYYSNPMLCLIPSKDNDAAAFLRRVKMLREEIRKCTIPIRTSREKVNQLFTRRQLQLHMQLAADTFSKDPKAEFDIYKAIMDHSPPSGKLSEYIVEFRRTVEQANSQCTERSEKYRISLIIVQMRIKLSVLLWIGRLSASVRIGANAELPDALKIALEEAQTVIDGEQPCSAESVGYRCDTVKGMHNDGQHSSVLTGGPPPWGGEFTSYPQVKLAIDNCKLVDLAKSALRSEKTLDVKEIRKQLSKVIQSECDEYPWLKSFPFYQVCVSCMVGLPTEVLSCGHIICAVCAKEVTNSSLSMMEIDLTCPICLSFAKWYPRNLPPLAGYRILSLDGGGIRGIVELLTLKKIMSFFPSMHIKDLFDIIVGTSTGGIIALALTVHAPNEQPKSLPKVMELFQDFCKVVFSSEMLRVGAGLKFFLWFCQIMGFYDTKYLNDNLLKLLDENFGEQLLLKSCARGPHVIVTSCDRDNNVAGAWFTSYNRKILENERDRRVPNNHLFSVKDAAAATSAAGTYFPPYKACNQWWIDGGLRYNCPAEVAIQEARTMSSKPQTIALISLGCGQLLYDEKPPPSESLISFLKLVVNVVTDSERQYNAAIEHLNQLQPDSSGCSIRINPTINVPKGKNCELDRATEIPFLIEQTEKYLANDNGLVCIHNAANLLFASLFYIDDGIDQDSPDTKLDKLSIRSRTALPQHLQDALMIRCSSSPPFSVTVRNASGVKSEFLWAQCTWAQNVMNLPFKLVGLPMLRPLVVEVKLHMCLPGTIVPKDWALGISGMPCKLGALD